MMTSEASWKSASTADGARSPRPRARPGPAPGIPAQPDGEGRLVVNISVDATEKVADAMGVSVVELYRLATQQRPRPSVRAGALSSRAFEGYEPGWHAHQRFGPMGPGSHRAAPRAPATVREQTSPPWLP